MNATTRRLAGSLAAEIMRLREAEDYGGRVQELEISLGSIIGTWRADEGRIHEMRYRTRAGRLTPDFEVALRSYLPGSGGSSR